MLKDLSFIVPYVEHIDEEGSRLWAILRDFSGSNVELLFIKDRYGIFQQFASS